MFCLPDDVLEVFVQQFLDADVFLFYEEMGVFTFSSLIKKILLDHANSRDMLVKSKVYKSFTLRKAPSGPGSQVVVIMIFKAL